MTPAKSKVLESLHNELADQCIDIFVRGDGSFGFEEFRRDYEDGGTWYSLNRFSHLGFASVDEAISQAKESVGWLADGMGGGRGQ